jgi:hypothetical protein
MNVVRLARYFITNPIPEPVALQLAYGQDPRGSWQAFESWKRFNVQDPTGRNAAGDIYLNRPDTSVAFSMDGFTYHNAMYWRVPYGTMTGVLSQGEYGAHPCGGKSGGHPAHRIGDRANKYICDASVGFSFFSTAAETGTFSSGDVSVKPYRVALELQGQERDPDVAASGLWVLVPPASGSVPGTLVVYLARPVTAPRSRALQWNLLAAPPISMDAVNHYQMWDYEWWWGYYQPWSILYPGYDTYVGFRSGAYLASAQDNLYGTLSGATQAYSGSSLLGESAPRLSVAFSQQPLTTH